MKHMRNVKEQLRGMEERVRQYSKQAIWVIERRGERRNGAESIVEIMVESFQELIKGICESRSLADPMEEKSNPKLDAKQGYFRTSSQKKTKKALKSINKGKIDCLQMGDN